MKGKMKRGFSLIELIIVIVILAVISAIALPRVSRGSKGANESAYAQNLSVLRSAIEMYTAEHDGEYPAAVTHSEAVFKNALTLYSDRFGNTTTTKDATHIYGPYIHKFPELTVGAKAGKNTVSVVSGIPAASGGDFGWVYSWDTGQIIGNCAAGELSEGGTAYNTW